MPAASRLKRSTTIEPERPCPRAYPVTSMRPCGAPASSTAGSRSRDTTRAPQVGVPSASSDALPRAVSSPPAASTTSSAARPSCGPSTCSDASSGPASRPSERKRTRRLRNAGAAGDPLSPPATSSVPRTAGQSDRASTTTCAFTATAPTANVQPRLLRPGSRGCDPAAAGACPFASAVRLSRPSRSQRPWIRPPSTANERTRTCRDTSPTRSYSMRIASTATATSRSPSYSRTCLSTIERVRSPSSAPIANRPLSRFCIVETTVDNSRRRPDAERAHRINVVAASSTTSTADSTTHASTRAMRRSARHIRTPRRATGGRRRVGPDRDWASRRARTRRAG